MWELTHREAVYMVVGSWLFRHLCGPEEGSHLPEPRSSPHKVPWHQQVLS